MAAYDDMLSLLDDPETLSLMLKARGAQGREGIAAQMMQPTMAQGRTTGPYGAYTAASPLEHLGNAVREGVGAGMYKGAQEQTGTGIEAFIQALRARQQAQRQAQQQAEPGPVAAPEYVNGPVFP